MMKTLIVCQSVHHGNTLRVAQAIAEHLGAELRKPSEVASADFDAYDLVGFGSGIYNGKHHASLLRLVEALGPHSGKKCFVFSTASICRTELHGELRTTLRERGFEVVAEFICRGFMNYSFTKLWFGGINKGRPNAGDLDRAREFAAHLEAGWVPSP